MNTDKLDEQMSLECPKCQGIEFDFDAATEDAEPSDETLVQCVKCGEELSYGALVAANSESVNQHVQSIGEDFAKDLTANLHAAIEKMGFGKKP